MAPHPPNRRLGFHRFSPPLPGLIANGAQVGYADLAETHGQIHLRKGNVILSPRLREYPKMMIYTVGIGTPAGAPCLLEVSYGRKMFAMRLSPA